VADQSSSEETQRPVIKFPCGISLAYEACEHCVSCLEEAKAILHRHGRDALIYLSDDEAFLLVKASAIVIDKLGKRRFRRILEVGEQ
jgi:hypothetical protein